MNNVSFGQTAESLKKKEIEAENEIREKFKKYFSVGLFFTATLIVGIALPILPVGGNYIVPILAAILISILVYEAPLGGKTALVYFAFFSVIVESIFAYGTLPPGIMLAEFIILFIIIIFVLPFLIRRSDSVALGFGVLAGALLIFPPTLPFGIAMLVLYAVYSRNLRDTAKSIVTALLMYQPIGLAMNVTNKANLIFASAKIFYITHFGSGTLSSIISGSTVSTVSASWSSASLLPIYLMGAIKNITLEFGVISTGIHDIISFKGYSTLASGFGTMGAYSLDLIIIGIVLGVILIIAGVILTLMAKTYKGKDPEDLNLFSKIFKDYEIPIFALILSLLILFMISQLSIPLSFTTDLAMTTPFLLGTVAVSVAGGFGISEYEIYVNRVIEAVRLRERIRDRYANFNNSKRKFEDTVLSRIDETVKENIGPYAHISERLTSDFDNDLRSIDSDSLTTLRTKAKNANGYCDELKNKQDVAVNQIIAFMRGELMRFNLILPKIESLTVLHFEGPKEEDIRTLDDYIIAYVEITRLSFDVSSKLSDVYMESSKALARMFPDEVPKIEKPAPGHSAFDVETIINNYIQPLYTNLEDKFDSYKNSFSDLLPINRDEYRISNCSSFLSVLDSEISKIIKYLDDTMLSADYLNGIIERITKEEIDTGVQSETSKIIAVVGTEKEKFSGWQNAAMLLDDLRDYMNNVKQKIEEAVNLDKAYISTLSLYSFLEEYIMDAVRSRGKIQLEDIPLNREFSKRAVDIFIRRNYNDFQIIDVEKGLKGLTKGKDVYIQRRK